MNSPASRAQATPGARCRHRRCRHYVKISFRFHSCFLKISSFFSPHTPQRWGIHIYSMNGKCSDALACLWAVRPFVGEQGPRRFQFPEVSGGPEAGWEPIHQPSQWPYCEASLHTQIAGNIRAWIRSHCPSATPPAGSGGDKRFPDYIHGRQVDLCSLSRQTVPAHYAHVIHCAGA